MHKSSDESQAQVRESCTGGRRWEVQSVVRLTMTSGILLKPSCATACSNFVAAASGSEQPALMLFPRETNRAAPPALLREDTGQESRPKKSVSAAPRPDGPPDVTGGRAGARERDHTRLSRLMSGPPRAPSATPASSAGTASGMRHRNDEAERRAIARSSRAEVAVLRCASPAAEAPSVEGRPADDRIGR